MRVYASAEMTLTDTNDGISVTGIDRYYMASSSSSGITVDSKGWEPDPQETNPISRYHWSYEVVNYSDGAKIPSKPAVIGVYGKEGKEGVDAVTVSLSSEAHTFAGTESRAIASSITIDISAFKGSQRIPTSIGTVTGGISGQLTHSELGRGTTNNKLVINATSSLSKGNGTLSIPIVADGRTFNKVFSWSVAFKGIDGTTTYTWIRYADTPTSGMSDSALDKKYIGLAFNQTTQTESNNYNDYQWSLMPQNIEVGGRNLLRNSGEVVSNGLYNIARYDLTDEIKEGEEVTLTIWGSLAATKSYFGAYNSGGSVSVTALKNNGNGTYSNTFKWKIGSSSNTHLNVYAFTNSQTGTSTINKIKLEKGNVTTDWTPAPEDLYKYSEDVAQAKADAERIKAEAYADGKVSDEEKLRIAQAEQVLKDAKAHALESIQNIEIGGRNLLRNTNFTDGLAYWTGGAIRELISDAVFGSVAKFTTTSNTGLVQKPVKELIVGKEYTLSTYVKAENTSQTVYLAIDGNGIGAAKAHTVSNEWTKISSVFTFSGVNLNARIYTSGVLYVANAKLEEGNKATDWTPAPEDTQSQIDDTKEQVKKTVKTITEEYYQSTSATSQTGGGWTEKAPSWQEGKFIFIRSKITYVDGETDYTPIVNITGAKGDTGKQGPDGPEGPRGIPGDKGDDGQSQWVHIRYSPNPTGSGMEPSPSSTTKYVGIAVTNSATAPPFPEFTWSKYVGENGDEGPRGLPGKNGTDGTTTYTWVRYADEKDGTGIHNFPDGKKFIGLAYNKTTPDESDNPNDYQWSAMYDEEAFKDVGLADKTEVLSDTEIYTDKADNAVVHVEIDGKSVQSIDSNAKNMVPTEYDDWMDGYHYAMQDGEPHRYANRMAVPWLIELKPNTSYYLNTGNADIFYVIRSFDSNVNMVSSSWMTGVSSGVKNSENDVKYIGVSLYTRTSSIDITNEFKNGNVKPLMQEDSNKNRDWVEYIQESPKPQKPMKIHSVGEFSLVSAKAKENILINGNFEDGLNQWADNTANTSSVESLPDYTNHKILRIDNSGGSGGPYVERYEWVIPNQKYTFSWIQQRTGTVIVESADVNNNRTNYFRRQVIKEGSYTRFHQTFIVPSDVYKVRIVLQARSNEHPLFMDLKLEKGDLSPYIPHTYELEDGLGDYGYKASFSLPEPLRSVGNAKDKLFRHSDGRWGVERHVRETVLDGSENWRDRTEAVIQLDNVNWYQLDISTSNFVRGVGLTSHFSRVSSTYTEDSPHVRIDGSSVIWLGVFPPKNMHSSLAEFQNWLKDEYSEGRPLTIHRVLSNPVIEWLDDNMTDTLNNIVSFSDDNYVFSTVDLEYAGNLLSRVSTLPDMWYNNIEPLEIPVASGVRQSATENAIPVKPNQELIMEKNTSLSGDNFWRFVYVDKLNNPIERRVSTSNRLTETVPEGAYGVRVSFPSDSGAQVHYSPDDKAGIMSERLKSTLYATFKGGGWYSRWKTEDELRKHQAVIDDKAGSTELNDTLTIVREEREKLGDLRTEFQSTKSNLLITHSEEWMNTITETANDVGGISNRIINIEQTKEQIDTFFKFDDALTIAKSNAQTKLRLTNDEIQFLDGETKGTYITGNNMVTQNLTIQDKLNLPNHTMESQEDLTIIRFIG